MGAAGAVTTVSRALLETALDLFPAAESKALVVHNCVPNSIAKAARASVANTALADKFDVLFVGNLIHRKGIDVLLHAFQAVRAQLPCARLAIVGGGKRGPRVACARRAARHQ